MNDLSNRMKEYEGMESARRFLVGLPVCARIDGKCFNRFTKGLKRPFDQRLTDLMCETTKYMVGETQANIGYAQSDEINLVWYRHDPKSNIFLDRKIQKMTSVLASMATAKFNRLLPEYIPEKSAALALFDCRVWQVPHTEEAANVFVWRELDATRNSIESAARHYYSHKELHKKNSNQMQEMLFQKGVNWDDYPACFKRGTYIQKHIVNRKFTIDEIKKLPKKHEAHTNPDLVFARTEIRTLNAPPILKWTNRVPVIIFGAEPLAK